MAKKIRNRAAAVIVQNSQILLVKHHKYDKYYWLLPGGGVNYGETLSDAVKREMKEETNLDVEVGDLICVSESIPPDHHRHVINYYFEARVLGGIMKVGDDKNLHDVQWRPIDELDSLTMYPNITKELHEWILSHKLNRFSLGNRWD